jgi:DNA-binding IclR family transcriptional regulator/sugar lactone lactonase YvrE
MAERGGEGTASLEKAIDVLEAVGASPHGIGHLDLASRLGLPKTTVYRILSTLVARGLVWRDPFRRVYCLGTRTIELAHKAFAMPDLVAAARLELRALRDQTGETTYLATLDGVDSVSLERFDGVHKTRSAAVLGVRKPIYCTSQGKAMLAFLETPERDAIVAQLSLKPLTEKTITDRRRLKAELKATAERGFAIDEEEIVMGVRCVGAPIIDPEGKVRGAISIAGPAYRMTRVRAERLGPEVAEAARRVGAQLGGSEPRAVAEPSAAVSGVPANRGAFPRWSARHRCLFWADAAGHALHRTAQGKDQVLAEVETPVAALALHRDGVLVAHAQGWHVVNEKGESKPRSGWPGAGLRALAARGNELWGVMQDGGGCHVGVLAVAGDFLGRWQVREPVATIVWDAAGERLYGIAPQSGSILVMHAESRGVKRLATMPQGSGMLGGIALDAKGGLWTALADGWAVVRFSPDGALTRVVALPVARPTDLAFGGPGMDTLYVTSAREGLTRETLMSAPLSGRLFELEVGAAGIVGAAIAQ